MKELTPLWTAGPKGSPLLLVRRIYVFPFYFPVRLSPLLYFCESEKGKDGFMLGLLGRLCSLRLNESNHQLLNNLYPVSLSTADSWRMRSFMTRAWIGWTCMVFIRVSYLGNVA
jgi:hypothetical protein